MKKSVAITLNTQDEKNNITVDSLADVVIELESQQILSWLRLSQFLVNYFNHCWFELNPSYNWKDLYYYSDAEFLKWIAEYYGSMSRSQSKLKHNKAKDGIQ